MKKIILLVFASALLVLIPSVSIRAQDQKKIEDSLKKVREDSLKNVAKLKVDSTKAAADAASEKKKKDEAEKCTSTECTKLLISAGFFVVMFLLVILFFMHLKAHNQRIGFQSIKLIGLILIFPGICIVALIGGGEILSGQTLAALLGTIAGYVLSKDDDTNKDVSADSASFRRRIADLNTKIEKAKKDIKSADDTNTAKTDPAYIKLVDELKKLEKEFENAIKTA